MADVEILGPGEDDGKLTITPIGGMDAATKSEINLQVEFAMQHPRSITAVRKELESLVTLNQSIAEESFYTLKRKDKNGAVKLIQGPSIRFAEVLCYVWKHVRWAKQISDVDNEFVTGEGVFMDLERNIVGRVRTKRRITGSDGRRYNADMIQTTGNAAASLAYRNAVTGSIPQALWKDVLEKAKVVAVGGSQSIGEKRNAALEYGKKIGVSETQIYETLGVQGINDLGIDELIALKGLFNSVKDSEYTIEEAFGDPFEKEVQEWANKAGWNAARLDLARRTTYKGKSAKLLEHLKEQAAPLNTGKADEAPTAQAEATTKKAAAKGKKETPAAEVAPEADTTTKSDPETTGSTDGGSTAGTETTEQVEPETKEEPKPEPKPETKKTPPAKSEGFNF